MNKDSISAMEFFSELKKVFYVLESIEVCFASEIGQRDGKEEKCG